MTEKLLHCPFCGPGQSMVDLWHDDVSKRWVVGCGRCGASSGRSVHREGSKEAAVKSWNTRSGDDAPSASESTPTKEDFAKWSRGWHDTVETIMTLLELPGGGSPQETLAQVQAYIGRPRSAASTDKDPRDQKLELVEGGLVLLLGAVKAGDPQRQIIWRIEDELRVLRSAPTTSPEPDAVRQALVNVRAAIMEADPAVLCDTLWMPNRISPAETAVDHIDAALSRPAHGGWEELKAIADFCSGDNSSLGAIARLAEVRRIASDALARHQGEGGGPRS